MSDTNKSGFCKVRFTGKHGSTAGLVLSYAEARHASITKISRYFPYSEANKMEQVQVSPVYETWEGAFKHQFDTPCGYCGNTNCKRVGQCSGW